MADDADVQDSEITPEDFDGEQETPKAESSPAKAEQKEEAQPEEKPEEGKDTAEEAKAESEESEETEGDEEVTDETKPKGAEERKSQLNTEIRDLVAKRNALKDEVKQINSQVYQPATEDDLVSEGMNATDAKVEALRQAIEVKEYNDAVADAQLTIESEAQRVMQDFPVFNPDSEQYDEELSNEAAQLLEANLVLDQNTGQIVGSNVSPYQIYNTLAKASGISRTKGQLKGQQATEKMLANADTSTSRAPSKKGEDPLAKLWEDPL